MMLQGAAVLPERESRGAGTSVTEGSPGLSIPYRTRAPAGRGKQGNREQRHREETFRDEFRSSLELHGIDNDERYILA